MIDKQFPFNNYKNQIIMCTRFHGANFLCVHLQFTTKELTFLMILLASTGSIPTEKYINITGDDFTNMVQLVGSTRDQVLSFWQYLPIATPERKLECSTEQGSVTSKSCLLLLHNIPPENSSLHASRNIPNM